MISGTKDRITSQALVVKDQKAEHAPHGVEWLLAAGPMRSQCSDRKEGTAADGAVCQGDLALVGR
eukprot:1113634-Pyramimonas_sp.AAC.1